MTEPREAGKLVRLLIENARDVTPGDFEGPKRSGAHDGEPPDLRPVEFSDDALAEALTNALGDDYRCAFPGAEWFRWDGTRWVLEKTDEVQWRARRVAREVAASAENDRIGRKISSMNVIYAMAKLASQDRCCATPRENFDANDWLLNTPAGTVDLRSGMLRPHERSDLITRTTPVAPAGDCPTFYSFLREATGGDVDSIAFLQRFMGYSLTGSTEEHAILLMHGPGGTGKSVLLNTWSAILGSYATTAPMDTFTVATGERHPSDLAMLDGARLVTASETEEGRRWDEAKLKAITGGDLITARRMRQDFFTFRPRFKLVVAGNYRPAMRSADDAMRRRFHVFPMLHKPAAADKALADKLRAELGGILKWALLGVIEWQRRGLAPPAAVMRATDEYFEAENAIGRWIQERCVKDRDKITATATLYQDFKSWAVTVGEYAGSERRFAQRLQTMGFDRARDPDTSRRGFRGLGVRGQTGELPLSVPSARGSGRWDAPDAGWRTDPADEFDR